MAATNYYYLLLTPTNELIKTTSSKLRDELVKYHSHTELAWVHGSRYTHFVTVRLPNGGTVKNARDVFKK